MKASFLNHSKPLLTAMVQDGTPEAAICTIGDSIFDGADALGIQLCNFKREYRTEEYLKPVFRSCMGRPSYITSYRGRESAGMTDEACVDLLLMGLRCGGTLCDVMGDLYDPVENQMSFNPDAVAKQKDLIAQIHDMGGEVLMSAHLHGFYEEPQILDFAFAQQERGADIVKLVSRAQTEEEMMADFQIIRSLKKNLRVPFLFLASGPYSRLLRQVGPSFGCCMYLCVQRYHPVTTKDQPILHAMRAVRDNIYLPME